MEMLFLVNQFVMFLRKKTKNFKGNIFSSVVKNSDSSSWCITEMFRYVLISMLHTLYLLNIMSNFWIVVFHQKSFCSPYLYWYRLWHSKTMPYGLLWKICWGYNAIFNLDKLMTMFNNFKVNLPQYHEMISIMIHKHVSTKPCLVLIY